MLPKRRTFGKRNVSDNPQIKHGTKNMVTQHSYLEVSLYEALIRRAFMQIDRSKNGAHSANMTNMIDAENGESWVSHLPKYDKQFSKIQSYLRKALNKILKWKLTDDEKSILIEQQLRLDNSTIQLRSWRLSGLVWLFPKGSKKTKLKNNNIKNR